jgi:hypothetical protein
METMNDEYENALMEQEEDNEEEDDGRKKSEWEKNWRSDTIIAFIHTIKNVLFHPISYFSKIKPSNDYLSISIFVYVNSLIYVAVAFASQVAFMALTGEAEEVTMGVFNAMCSLIFVPFVSVALVFIVSGIYHLFFTMVGGSQKKYNTTLTLWAYSQSTSVLGIVPVLGVFIAMIYGLVIVIGGGAKFHEISNGKAALSVLVPVLICCCVFGLGILAITLLAGGMGAMMENFIN